LAGDSTMTRVRPVERRRAGAEAAAEAGRAEAADGGAGVRRGVDCLILNLGGMCMLYNHIQNTHSILYLFHISLTIII